MKLVLSRKGFDSSSGGCPNPIFPDGRMLALPIPDKSSMVSYKDIRFDEMSLGPLVNQLTKGKIKGTHKAHLDPDLDPHCYPREAGWAPLLGQHGAAQGHLRNYEIGAGDVFLFFGLFKEIEKVQRRWQFVKGAKPKHVLWGWMFVEHVVEVSSLSDQDRSWLAYHPHLQWADEKNNVLYVASTAKRQGIPGCGMFSHYGEHLCLSDSGSDKPSAWKLPGWFYPERRPPLSYHSRADRWLKEDNYCRLQSAARGQEFVLDLAHYPEALSWLQDLVMHQH